MAPDHFLKPNLPNPATVNKDGDWGKILLNANLQETDISTQESGTGGSGNNDVSIKSTDLGGLEFSSQGNLPYFGQSLSVDTMRNDAWVGDNFDSGIMLLTSSKSDLLALRGSNAFLDLVDASKMLEAKIHSSGTALPNPNALWCVTTATTYKTVLQLSFDLSADPAAANSPLAQAISWVNQKQNLGIHIDLQSIVKEFPNIPDIIVTLKKTSFYTLDALIPSQTYSLSFQFSVVGFDFAVDFSALGMSALLKPSNSSPAIYSSILQAVGSPDGLDSRQMPSGAADDLFYDFFEHVDLWYVRLDRDMMAEAQPATLNWGVGLLVHWTTKSKTTVLAGLTYASNISAFIGRLILAGDLASPAERRLPEYDHRTALPSDIDPNSLPEKLDLWDLISDHGNPPDRIPTSLAAAQVSYQTLAEGSIFSFLVDLVSDDSSSQGSQPGEAPDGFVWDDISVLAEITTKKDKTRGTSVVISSNMALISKDDSTIPSALLNVSLSYDNSSGSGSQWMLRGSVRNLSVALLADYFEEDCRDGAMAILGKISLKDLDMTYVYTSGAASSFLITAVLKLGELELDLSYQYVSALPQQTKTAAQQQWGDNGENAPNGVSVRQAPADPDNAKSSWVFEAYLRTDSPDSTIASIAESIVPGAASKLPNFVGEITVTPPADPTNSLVRLEYKGDNAKGSILAVWISIGPFNLTFVQYRTGGNTAIVKRILRISVDQIPMLDKVPLVNQMPQPFDHLIYLWVEDDEPSSQDPSLKGFTRDMITASTDTSVNSVLGTLGIPPIQLKESKTPVPTDIVLQSGHHFVIVSNGKVVLDHVFGTSAPATPAVDKNPGGSTTPPTTPPPPPPPPPPAMAPSSSFDSDPAAPEAPATKGNTNTKAGPLTVSGLSLQYKKGSLFIGLDASLILGPLSFGVQGFTLEIEISKVKLDSLADLVTKDLIHASIHGLEAGISKEPLTLKGVFIHDTASDEDTTVESYRGGIAVGLKAWDILAVGEYKIVTTKSDGHQHKSVFIYGKLDGPLVTLEFATISGVRVGFGFNSEVYLPSAELLYTFPFINDAGAGGAGTDPMLVLNSMVGGNPAYVYTKEGACWFCAGMTITCFDCISLTAVLMFEISTKAAYGGATMALLADGVFQMEPLSPPEFSLFYIELLIKVEINLIEGYIAADAALAPASHVYVPEAHLTGSGSFYTWFPPSSHAGDWVVTIGGYHRAFTIPAHYPNPNRLGLSFTVGDNIQVVGQGYVAVTPKAAMAGGSLHMSLSVGPVDAYCDVALDVFINFKPFYFIAHISLSVGVQCDIDLLFVTIHLSVSIGADLVLWGPNNFGGLAHVDFWFFGFDIGFGDRSKAVGGVSLEEFYDIIRTPGPKSDPPKTDQTTADNPYMAQHKYSIEAGIFPLTPKTPQKTPKTDSASTDDGKPPPPPPFPNTGAGTEWLVQSGTCQFRIDCDFALNAATLINSKTDPTQNIAILPSSGAPPQPIYSFPMHVSDPHAITSTVEIRIFSDEGGVYTLEPGFSAEPVMKQASTAVWGAYDILKDPLVATMQTSSSGLQNANNATVSLCMGIRIFPPKPYLSQSPVVDFDATAAMRESWSYPAPTFDAKEQTTYRAEAFEPGVLGTTQWVDLGAQWGRKVDAQTSGGLSKAEVRGDGGSAGGGLIGLCAHYLGWDRRPPAGKSGNEPVPGPDGRMEWQLESRPPVILPGELDYYYPALPVWTTAP